jgi:hypothetical protein
MTYNIYLTNEELLQVHAALLTQRENLNLQEAEEGLDLDKLRADTQSAIEKVEKQIDNRNTM